jgi:hypothetical protein
VNFVDPSGQASTFVNVALGVGAVGAGVPVFSAIGLAGIGAITAAVGIDSVSSLLGYGIVGGGLLAGAGGLASVVGSIF